jgi:DNA anti-recombination protein RmuC
MEARTELNALKKEIKTIRNELAKAQTRINRLLDKSLLRMTASQGTSAVHKVNSYLPSLFDES